MSYMINIQRSENHLGFDVMLNGVKVGFGRTYFEADNIAAGVERQQHRDARLAADINAAPDRRYEH